MAASLDLSRPVSTSYMDAPVRFIRGAEECGLIAKIGAYALALLASLVLTLTLAGIFVVWEGAREYERQSARFTLGLPTPPISPGGPSAGPALPPPRPRAQPLAGAGGGASINSVGLAPFAAAAAASAMARPVSSASSSRLPRSALSHAQPEAAAAASAGPAAPRRSVAFDLGSSQSTDTASASAADESAADQAGTSRRRLPRRENYSTEDFSGSLTHALQTASAGAAAAEAPSLFDTQFIGAGAGAGAARRSRHFPAYATEFAEVFGSDED